MLCMCQDIDLHLCMPEGHAAMSLPDKQPQHAAVGQNKRKEQSLETWGLMCARQGGLTDVRAVVTAARHGPHGDGNVAAPSASIIGLPPVARPPVPPAALCVLLIPTWLRMPGFLFVWIVKNSLYAGW